MQYTATRWPVRRSFTGSLRLLLLAACLTAAVSASAADELAAIRDTVFDYFEGINQVDRDRLERAFDPSATLKSVDASGALVVEPIADAMARWMQGQATERRGDILSIDMAGGQVARVVFNFDGDYVDFLTLVKLDGHWRIINKVFIRT
ncbi:nuclear transport factor 2 family protein [Chromatocurvus halotolerans]|uniref:Putative lumazine-binding protein n=1 Tax=Chromatocurvus halotolerans TaxID=1132028 RepID=A0A4R2KPF6_9GAMM|nr:nuclear transport factor 2 family protein [Chromatocurvus halotolerans]TCO76081.1 putative lumazine-binding protein [Chromatocurvus halotolerans]